MDAVLNPQEVTVLWHGWLRKLGRFSKRWRRRYFIFLSTDTGIKELRHYDSHKDVQALLQSAPKGVIALTDATGICCFVPSSPPSQTTRKPTMFSRSDSSDRSTAEALDQKFAVLTPAHVHLLAFQSGKEWGGASESQQGLSLLASLSAFYPAVEVLHAGFMSKKREHTVHTPKSIMSYWKRHYFLFLSTGDLLYFRDESLSELQGRVDVRHAPTVRVTGERMLEERKKELGVLKFARLPPTYERETCLVWIATPPSKMFVLKVQEDRDGITPDGKRHELTPVAKKWLSLLLQGHAETKYTQLEHCISTGKFELTPEVTSAIRTGIPDELRGHLWKGFSGAGNLQRQAESRRTTRKVSKTTNIRTLTSKDASSVADPPPTETFFDEFSAPLEVNALHTPENRMLYSRLCAIAFHQVLSRDDERSNHETERRKHRPGDASPDHVAPAQRPENRQPTVDSSIAEEATEPEPQRPRIQSKRNSLKQIGKGKFGQYVYPSDAPAPEWEVCARRRLIIATSRFNPFSHPCPWRVLCLLLAYLDEESAFWVINSILDVAMPGYFHGHRPGLQIDVAAFVAVLEDRDRALAAHLSALAFPVEHTVERWLLSLFTSSSIPLPTVLRIWDAFFAQGIRILFGVGIAIFLRAADKLIRSRTAKDAIEILSATEQGCIDADVLFSHVFKEDFNIPWLSDEQFEKIRHSHRQRVIDHVSTHVEHFNDKLAILSQLQDHLARTNSMTQRLLNRFDHPDPSTNVSTNETDGESTSSLVDSVKILKETLLSGMQVLSSLSAQLNKRQALWLALSSQVSACPLSRGMTTDLQSWLLQVREGKISGAGHDTITSTDVFSVSTSIDRSDLFFEEEVDETVSWSCLVNSRSEFVGSQTFHTESFLYAMVSTVKATCSLRLECLTASHRFRWHNSSWLDSTMEYPVTVLDRRPERSTRNYRRSSSTTSKPLASTTVKWKPRPLDDSDLNRRNSFDDAAMRRHVTFSHQTPSESTGLAFVPQSLPRVNEQGLPSRLEFGDTDMDMVDSPYFSTTKRLSPTVNDNEPSTKGIDNKKIGDAADEFAKAERVLRSAADIMMSCFSRFIRVENRQRGWELRERALLLEDDLVQELKLVDLQLNGAFELY